MLLLEGLNGDTSVYAGVLSFVLFSLWDGDMSLGFGKSDE